MNNSLTEILLNMCYFNSRINIPLLLVISLLSFSISPCLADNGETTAHSIAPILKSIQKDQEQEPILVKWRIAYYQGASNKNHHDSLIAIINGLMEIRWLEPQEIPTEYQTYKPDLTKKFWDWLNANIRSDYIEFVPDGFWTLEVTDEEDNKSRSLRLKLKQEILNRLNGEKDIDLMLAMGPDAGSDLANTEHEVDTVIAAVPDPVVAGIVKSYEYSGFPHIVAKSNPNRYEQQIRLFHDIIDFENLGIAYEKNQAGRTQGAIDKVELMAKERGFELVPCHFRDVSTEKAALESGIECYNFLARNADAVYITRHPKVVTLRNLPRLLFPLERYRVETFSQIGSIEVEQGALMSIAVSKYIYVGQFYAQMIAQIFNGASPGKLPQIFNEPRKLAINLETAKKIKYDPPIDIIGIADEIYGKI